MCLVLVDNFSEQPVEVWVLWIWSLSNANVFTWGPRLRTPWDCWQYRCHKEGEEGEALLTVVGAGSWLEEAGHGLLLMADLFGWNLLNLLSINLSCQRTFEELRSTRRRTNAFSLSKAPVSAFKIKNLKGPRPYPFSGHCEKFLVRWQH